MKTLDSMTPTFDDPLKFALVKHNCTLWTEKLKRSCFVPDVAKTLLAVLRMENQRSKVSSAIKNLTRIQSVERLDKIL